MADAHFAAAVCELSIAAQWQLALSLVSTMHLPHHVEPDAQSPFQHGIADPWLAAGDDQTSLSQDSTDEECGVYMVEGEPRGRSRRRVNMEDSDDGEATVQELVHRLMRLESALATEQAQRSHEQRQLAEALRQVAGQHQGTGVGGAVTAALDLKQLEPMKYAGKEAEFPTFSIKTASYLCKGCPELETMLEHALLATTVLRNSTMGEKQVQLSKQVYYALTMLCEGEALKLIQSRGKGEGMEARRQLHHEWKPKVTTQKTADLVAILEFKFTTDLVRSVLALDVKIKEYQEKHGKTLDCDTLVSSVHTHVPNRAVRQRLLENAERYATWEDVKADVLNLRRIECLVDNQAQQLQQTSRQEPVPMEIGMVRGPQGPCYRCGGAGHIARDCPSPEEETVGPSCCGFCGCRGHEEQDCWENREASVLAHKRREEKKAKGKAKGKGKGKGFGKIHVLEDEAQPKPEPEGEDAQINTLTQSADALFAEWCRKGMPPETEKRSAPGKEWVF
ncbi:unnamed protein product [Polarella glacialis]|uniref:CCHC-type domain-containing protein n=1 Tax=Polarella glacialis TaxID=89957 RepID=A0A813JV48_POLGL|nr:unnamed protein product [Polarella glacialis]CAE8687821.1 unnamed protein product [Polarella glacialis]